MFQPKRVILHRHDVFCCNEQLEFLKINNFYRNKVYHVGINAHNVDILSANSKLKKVVN